jgi:hypothetical protein
MTKPAWRKLLDERPELIYALGALLLAALVLLPRLGSYGLWDPQEFPSAETAREVVRTGDWSSVSAARPPLTIWATAAGIELFGVSELGARLPHALMALAAVMLAYATARRVRGPRAGFLSALVLATFPLFLFQARQLTTDMGGLLGSALLVYGMVGLTWPDRERHTPLAAALDAVALVVGTALSYYAWGLVHALLVPGFALAVASGSALAAGFAPASADRARAQRTAHLVAAVAGGVVVLAVAGWLQDHWNAKGYLRPLGGAFRPGEPPATATYDYILDQLAFGLFPWCAIAPLAVARLAVVRRGDREAWAGIVLVAWAVAAYAASSLWVREIGEQRYPALVPVALAVGLALDDVLAARGGDEARLPGARAGLPIVAIFAALCAVQISRDIKAFPVELASVHLLGSLQFPAVLKISKAVMVLGIFFGVLAAVGLGAPRRDAGDGAPSWLHAWAPVTRWALPAAIALGWGTGAFLSQVYTPALSQHFSYKNVFDAYHAHAKDGEGLGVSGIAGSGPDFYSRGKKIERLAGTPAITEWLKQTGRVFAVAPATELCAIHQAMNLAGRPYHVVDSENSRFFLYSNALGAGEKDENPLATMIRRAPPEHIGREVHATFRAAAGPGEIELIGVDMPDAVKKGSTFKMTLHFKVNERVPSNQKIFVHFDKGGRFQGDHDPLRGLCGTAYWQPGDYVSDTFEVTASTGQLGTARGQYQVFVGFFTGSSGNYRNMKVTSGNADKADRFILGTLTLK